MRHQVPVVQKWATGVDAGMMLQRPLLTRSLVLSYFTNVFKIKIEKKKGSFRENNQKTASVGYFVCRGARLFLFFDISLQKCFVRLT